VDGGACPQTTGARRASLHTPGLPRADALPAMFAPLTVIAWDPRKADLNEFMHGVGFDEATAAFLDVRALLIADPDHPQQRRRRQGRRHDRLILLGASARFCRVVACHCYREQAHVIRIISARKATQHEAAQYVCEDRPRARLALRSFPATRDTALP